MRGAWSLLELSLPSMTPMAGACTGVRHKAIGGYKAFGDTLGGGVVPFTLPVWSSSRGERSCRPFLDFLL